MPIEMRPSDKTMHIMEMFVAPHRRGRGEGFRLIKKAAIAARNCGCTWIKLDDMTDFYRAHNNIYVRAAFLYDHDEGPEMTARVATTLRRLREICQKN